MSKEKFFTDREKEMTMFRKQMLKGKKKDIYDSSYKISMFKCFDDILEELYEEETEIDYDALICAGDNLYEYLFWEWVSYEDAGYLEKKEFIIRELKNLAGRSCGAYVIGSCKAA